MCSLEADNVGFGTKVPKPCVRCSVKTEPREPLVFQDTATVRDVHASVYLAPRS